MRKLSKHQKAILAHGFSLEDHLLKVINKHLASLLLGRGKKLLAKHTKFAVGMIVPDLVLVIRRQKLKSPSRTFPLSLFDCAVLAAIIRIKNPTQAEIAEKVFARSSVIQASMDKLLRSDLIVIRSNKLYLKRRIRLQFGRVTAVEAKLIRWRDALQQAKSYLQFANHSYVALPETLIDRIKTIRAECRKSGVGLIAVNGKTCRITLKAPMGKIVSAEWLWVLNKTQGLAN